MVEPQRLRSVDPSSQTNQTNTSATFEVFKNRKQTLGKGSIYGGDLIIPGKKGAEHELIGMWQVLSGSVERGSRSSLLELLLYYY